MEYARDLEKNRFLVYLTRTPLPPDLQLRHNRNFAIQKYRMSEADFYDKLYTADGLAGCRGGDRPQVRRQLHPFRTLIWLLLVAFLCAVLYTLLQPEKAVELFHLPEGFRLPEFLAGQADRAVTWFRQLAQNMA